LRRAPALLVVVVGLLWWHFGGGPRDRGLTWELPKADRASLRRIDVELWEEGHLLARQERSFPNGGPETFRQEASLPDGPLVARVTLHRVDGGTEARQQTIQLGRESEHWVVVSER
jgi:hypothetical protein